MGTTAKASGVSFVRDLTAGLVVFLVALPLCLGVALASKAPAFAGVMAGIIGGILVGLLSGSQSSVSGPAAGLTAIVAAQITTLGFEAFLFAVVVAGVIQIILGLSRLGFIAAFFPSSVIKGLLAAIGVILIMKQFPAAVGYVPPKIAAPEVVQQFGDRIWAFFKELNAGSAVIGIGSIAFLVAWDKIKKLKYSLVPAPLVVVLLGVAASQLFRLIGEPLGVPKTHLVDFPVAETWAGFFDFIQRPDFSQWTNKAIYVAGFTIAAVASLETLLNLEAVDKIDPLQRSSPPNRELLAQGIGNTVSGLLGGLPVTSVIVRSSVNINAGGRSKISTVVHGILLLVCGMFMPKLLNLIPLSCLAGILIVTGFKLASWKLVKQMWQAGYTQFVPFMVTLVAIVSTDLLIGTIVGFAVSVGFILRHSMKSPLRRIVEKHLLGEVTRLELSTQVTFLNQAALAQALDDVPEGGHVLLDARGTEYIDPDVLNLIKEFQKEKAPARGVVLSLMGFKEQYDLKDTTQYVDYSTREVQSTLSPAQVLEILRAGNERFRTGQRLTRDLGRQVNGVTGEHPLAIVLSCVDSRSPTELIFDVGMGDICSVRTAGNTVGPVVLGSLEYGCVVGGAKLVLVMGHTHCGAVTSAVDDLCLPETPAQSTGCKHLEHFVEEIKVSVPPEACQNLEQSSAEEQRVFFDEVARRNVERSVQVILKESPVIARLASEGKIAVAGAMYNVAAAQVEFLPGMLS